MRVQPDEPSSWWSRRLAALHEYRPVFVAWALFTATAATAYLIGYSDGKRAR